MKARRHYTLIELMAVLSVLVIVLGTAGTLYSDAMLTERGFSKRAMQHQKLHLLHQRWQNCIHDAPEDTWEANEDYFTSLSSTVFQYKNYLVIKDDGDVVCIPLPDRSYVTFEIEQDNGMDIAVMHIEWTESIKRRTTTQQIRLVASYWPQSEKDAP